MKLSTIMGGCMLATGLLASSAWAESTVLTTANWVPPTHHLVKNVMEPWTAQLEEATEGRVTLNTLPASPIAAADYMDAIRNGVLDIGFTVHGYTPGRFTLTGIAELPFLGDSAEVMSVAYQRVHERYLAKANEHRGLVVLAVFTHGPGQMFNVKQPVDGLSDLVGMKWRVGGGIVNEAAGLLQTTAFLKPAGETYELMSSGIADGVFFPMDTMVTYRLAEIVEYATIIPGGFYNTSFALVMNKKRFDSLSQQDQVALMRISGENFARMAGRSWDGGDKAGLKALTEAGAEITSASPKLVSSLKSALAPLDAQWIEAAAEKGVDGAAALTDFRAELKKLEQEAN